MGDIRRNISRSEMACRDNCGFTVCDTALMDVLQETVDHFSLACVNEGHIYLKITGPNRCVAHNEVVQKEEAAKKNKVYVPFSSKSTHTLGIAADFQIKLKRHDGTKEIIPPIEVYDYLDGRFPSSCGLGLYSNRVHFDVRPYRARWGK